MIRILQRVSLESGERVGGKDLARIEPFRALRYNPDRISFISRVVAPPYDVIEGDLRKELLKRDPHNVIRLILGKTPAGGRGEQEYLEAARHLAAWRREGVLIRDEKPSVYMFEQHFEAEGERTRRLGFVAALLLEEFGSGQVFPHERTMSGPKADRLQLMRACSGNLSQVLGIYSDPDGQCDRFVQQIKGNGPIYEYRDRNGTACALTRMDDPGAIRELQQLLRDRALCIADGHHRYETALAYRREARPASAPPGSAPQDFTTALCVSVADRGLKALPVHRVAKAAGRFDGERLLRELRQGFEMSRAHVKRAEDLQRAWAALRADGAEIGCYLVGGKLFGLRAKQGPTASVSQDEPPDVRALPVSALNDEILVPHFGVDPYQKGGAGSIAYHHEAESAYWDVESGRFDAGFLLPPLEPRLVELIARSGQRLPPKSTFFYPKMPSGLVMYPFENG